MHLPRCSRNPEKMKGETGPIGEVGKMSIRTGSSEVMVSNDHEATQSCKFRDYLSIIASSFIFRDQRISRLQRDGETYLVEAPCQSSEGNQGSLRTAGIVILPIARQVLFVAARRAC